MTVVWLARILGVVLLAGGWAAGAAVAQGPHTIVAFSAKVFRIGTGGEAGTYDPIGRLLARGLYEPPGAPCPAGAQCGVPGLLAAAVATAGSVANVNAVGAGRRLESGLAQSDVAYWAHTGARVHDGIAEVEGLRAIASLYPESVHLVARPGAGVESVADLKGKRVSLDAPGSGTLINARIILAAHGLSERDLTVEHLRPDQAAERMRQGRLDAFFFVGGVPSRAIAALAAGRRGVRLVPIDGAPARRLLAEHPFFFAGTIPAGAYPGVARPVATLNVSALWITSAAQPADLVYQITRTLWSDSTRRLLAHGHPAARAIALDHALHGVAIPLHPGAKRFYREAGLLP